MRDSFVCYRSLIEATEDLEGELFKRIILAAAWYAMDGKEPELNGLENSVFLLIKPIIDRANERYRINCENGKKGGRPKGSNNKQKKPTKTHKNPKEPTSNLNEDDNEDVNDNVNVNDNENVIEDKKESVKRKKPPRHRHGEFKHVLLTDDQFDKLINDHGIEKTAELIKILDDYCEQSGKTYKNYSIVLNGWVLKRWEEDQRKGAYGSKSPPDRQNELYEWANA